MATCTGCVVICFPAASVSAPGFASVAVAGTAYAPVLTPKSLAAAAAGAGMQIPRQHQGLSHTLCGGVSSFS